MTTKLLIFDWDGTLMDSQARIVHSMQEAFRALGRSAPAEAAIRAIIGLSLDTAIERLDQKLAPRERRRLAAEYREKFNVAPVKSSLFPGTTAVLDSCLESGFELAIATGKSHDGLHRALDETGLSTYFGSVRTADRCESKPSPAMIEELLWETNIEAGSAVMIGDTSFDLQMATSAGVRGIAACYGSHERPQLAEHEPIFFLECIDELPDKLALLSQPNQT
ncbi:MAG: HAD-IA family hydrolase [Gammaproteobacteria bacterium]